MINQTSQFFAILTNIGVAKQANADALGVPWKLTQMAVGDANDTDPIPDAKQTRLINERRRAPLNQLKIDPANPAIIIAEQVIPAEVGGWWIREIGLYDADGDLVAIANCAPSFKPLLNQGSGRTQVVRINLLVSNSSNVELKIDPSVVLATRKYVDDSIINVLPADKAPGTYTKVTINARGMVTAGSNPTTLGGYGITDAMPKGQGGLGTTAPLVNDIGGSPGTTFFSSTPETFAKPPEDYTAGLHIKYPDGNYCIDIAGGITAEGLWFRRLDAQGNGPWRTIYHSGNFAPGNKADKATTLGGYGIVLPTQEQAEAGVDNTMPMTALRVKQALALLVGNAPAALDALNELAAAIGNDPNFATTMATALGLKAPLNSPALTGTPTAPTLAPGTYNQQLANAILVRTSIGNRSGFALFPGASPITAAYFGQEIQTNSATPFNLTLPASALGFAGASIKFVNTGSAIITINPNGTDVLLNGITSTVMTLPPGSDASFTLNNANTWTVSGTAVNYQSKTIVNALPSRALGVTYTNNTGKPMTVSLQLVSTSPNQSCTLNVNGFQFVGSSIPGSGQSIAGSFPVPIGATYSVPAGSYTLATWLETY